MKVLLLLFFIVYNLSVASGEKFLSKKIVFFSKFTSFIKWTDAKNSNEKFVIGVLGFNPFGDKLSSFYKNKTVLKRPVEIIEVQTLEEIEKCHILFISQSAYTLDKILSVSHGKGTLLISHHDGWAEKGVHINYYIKNDRLKFELNQHAAAKDNVAFKGPLLRYIRIVETK